MQKKKTKMAKEKKPVKKIKKVLKEKAKTEEPKPVEETKAEINPEEVQKEATFKDTFNYLATHGWTKLSLIEYIQEKQAKKYQTARVGRYGYFRLNKSDEEIRKAKENANKI